MIFIPFNGDMLLQDAFQVCIILFISQVKSSHEIPFSVFRHDTINGLNIIVILLINFLLLYFTIYLLYLELYIAELLR